MIEMVPMISDRNDFEVAKRNLVEVEMPIYPFMLLIEEFKELQEDE
jgi:hypothetical protein